MKIDFYIAGIQKSGTTNLAYLLSKSSNIITHPQTECTFFYDENEYNKGVRYFKKTYFFKKEHLHHPHYRLIKHSNSFVSVDTFKRVLQHSPDVQFLLVFRDPVQRFFSSYMMERARSLYPYDIKQAMKIAFSDKQSVEHRIFYSFGEYDKWIERIMKEIDRKHLYFFLFEELYNDVEHHFEQFAKKYGLAVNMEFSMPSPIQNAHKEYKYYWYQKVISSLKRSGIKGSIKRWIPARHWANLVKRVEGANFTEPKEKYKMDTAEESILREKYYHSIKRFEAITGLKTIWLNNN